MNIVADAGAVGSGVVISEDDDVVAFSQRHFQDDWNQMRLGSVVFAQARPAMKKKMVTEIIARVPSAVTLAVGDGANDTDMICAAHVGVGIAGVEGTAASNSADYAIGTFRFLHELLLVHGFWSYQRISQTVYFIFYKASLLALTNWLFGFYSQSSGTQVYNELVFQLYHIALTSLPILFVAVFDKPLPAKALMNTPSIYRESKVLFIPPTFRHSPML